MTQVNLEIPDHLHQKIQIQALLAHQSLSDFMQKWLESHFTFERTIDDYNAETQQILRESEQGINLQRCDSIESLCLELGVL